MHAVKKFSFNLSEVICNSLYKNYGNIVSDVECIANHQVLKRESYTTSVVFSSIFNKDYINILKSNSPRGHCLLYRLFDKLLHG